MCEQYWPVDDKTESHGGYTLRVESEQSLANFTIRTLKIWKRDTPEADARRVLQFHYTEWPCHTGPFPTALLDFRRRVRQIITEKPEFGKGETLVHCK
ncbi:unnamed protein product [Allacma fusca]|uniref:Tyrosine-protein phosphatase domain-containing protein n=1 Tax=Allacma fusca TaxID=39272 RepID=A0A8J2LNK5_9HEXA|nr:unnamed protein product [Allacma fusca]